MSFIQLESLEDLREKNDRRRYKRSIAVAALLTGTVILGTLFISGFFHDQILSIGPGLDTSLAPRPDYPVSAFLYDRRTFKWFIGLTAQVVLGGAAIFGAYTACVAVTGGLGAAACGLAALGVVGAAVGIIGAASAGGGQVVTNDLELGESPDLDYVRNGSKRDEDDAEYIQQLMRVVFGQDYKFEGHATDADERHAHIVALNGGKPVPVHSFTSAKGIRFHHSMIATKENTGLFHRFGFAPAENETTVSKRTDVFEKSNEYFKSGGFDLFDCAATGKGGDHLTSGDSNKMESLIKCNDPNVGKATELSIQVYDATTMETIGSGKIAPFGKNGKSIISGEKGTSGCPASQPPKKSCPMETE